MESNLITKAKSGIEPKLKRGVLLLNLGTPAEPTPKEVGNYLKEFLMDPDVIDLPFLLRWFLVHVIIVPKRAKSSARLYQKVWTEAGSPLAYYQRALAEAVGKSLERSEGEWLVADGMRYGSPSIRERLSDFKANGAQQVLVIPLYPQFCAATTGSSVRKCEDETKKLGLEVSFCGPFFSQPDFIQVWKDNIQRLSQEFRPDSFLFSFHGLPERQLLKADSTRSTCLKSASCCDSMTEVNASCYRAQCVGTAQRIASALGLPREGFQIVFQSRLGRAKWIGPYAEDAYRELARSGKKRLLVAAPSFVADCLETLEEIQIRAKEEFISLGGEDLKIVPCPNADPSWVEVLCKMIKRHGSESQPLGRE